MTNLLVGALVLGTIFTLVDWLVPKLFDWVYRVWTRAF